MAANHSTVTSKDGKTYSIRDFFRVRSNSQGFYACTGAGGLMHLRPDGTVQLGTGDVSNLGYWDTEADITPVFKKWFCSLVDET